MKTSKRDMILNKDVFQNDPTAYEIPNDGYTKVAPITTEQEWEVARWELQHFVCEGSYYTGLKKILDSFLDHLDQPKQPAVWVSGFFGSGKSHLVRILDFLWADITFSDGATARTLARLPDDIQDSLKRLDTETRRAGGIWSAAGTLSGGDSHDPREAVLQVILRAAGYPDHDLQLARIHLWLAQQGILDTIRSDLKSMGKEDDLQYCLISPAFAQVALKYLPDLGPTPQDLFTRLDRQFPEETNMTTDLMVSLIDEILKTKIQNKKKPGLVLIVLDEVQQYLAVEQDSTKLVLFQEIVEALTSKFESRCLLVATGQEALHANPYLQKLMGKFSLYVPLESKDVDTVLRQTILRKKESEKPKLSALLESVHGEITRQIEGSKIAHSQDDNESLVPDYPLLPSRKRLWDHILRSIDRGGLSTQLRNQLRLTFSGIKTYAESPLGYVIPVDYIYSQQRPYLINNGILPQETDEMIRGEDDSSSSGQLKSRICALLFLIQQVDTSLGVRATPETITDLLLSGLEDEGVDLRREVPLRIDDLKDRGIISDAGDGTLRIQTREGKRWDQEYRKNLNAWKDDINRISFDRDQALMKSVQALLKQISYKDGDTKTVREIDARIFTEDKPPVSKKIPVWVRNGWGSSEEEVRKTSLEEGPESPLIQIFLPKHHHQDLIDHIAGSIAAQQTMDSIGVPNTNEGIQAKKNIETKKVAHDTKVQAYLDDIISQAVVYLGGGDKKEGGSPKEVLLNAVKIASEKKFYRFKDADNPRWADVFTRIKSGHANPLSVIGHSGNTEEHNVCKEILRFLNANSKKGSEIVKYYEDAPFGWPKDAIEGAIIALCASGHLHATNDSHKTVSLSDLDNRRTLEKSFFTCESESPPTAEEKLKAKAVYQKVGIQAKAGSEGEDASLCIEKLRELLEKTGGDPPLPEVMIPSYLAEMDGLSGVSLLKRIAAQKDIIISDIEKWKSIVDVITVRQQEWSRLCKLLDHGEGLSGLDVIIHEAAAIKEHRSLLSDPDPVTDLLFKVQERLREEISHGISQVSEAYQNLISSLEGDPNWHELESHEQEKILSSHHIREIPQMPLGTDEEIIHALKRYPLSDYQKALELINLSRGLIVSDAAHLYAAKHKKVLISVTLKRGVKITNEEELEIYIDDIRKRVNELLQQKQEVLIQ